MIKKDSADETPRLNSNICRKHHLNFYTEGNGHLQDSLFLTTTFSLIQCGKMTEYGG